MPLYKSITVDSETHVLIWKIEETLEQLSKNIILTGASEKRLKGMKSGIHQRGFMSIRQLLAIAGYTDLDLSYNEFGKPFLKDKTHISITHSFEFSAIILSSEPVGIDVEKQREKIQKIAHKFVNNEQTYLQDKPRNIRMLTVIWGAKESLYKIAATPGLSFFQHIHVHPFSLDNPFTAARISKNEKQQDYDISFLEFEGYTCVYAKSIEIGY